MQSNPNIDNKKIINKLNWEDPNIIYYYNKGVKTKSQFMKKYYRKTRRKRLDKQYSTAGKWIDSKSLFEGVLC